MPSSLTRRLGSVVTRGWPWIDSPLFASSASIETPRLSRSLQSDYPRVGSECIWCMPCLTRFLHPRRPGNRVCRWRAVRPRGLVHAIGRSATGVFVRAGFRAGHADEPRGRLDGGGCGERLRRRRSCSHPSAIRRGEVRTPHRTRNRSRSRKSPSVPIVGVGVDRQGGHPRRSQATRRKSAKRTFQALRIEVNAELTVLRGALPRALDVLSVGGRIVVMSYQSLEDRIVKSEFAARTSIDAPPDLPVVPQDMQPSFRLLTRGAEMASDAEVESNSRAASVRLRAVERVAA